MSVKELVAAAKQASSISDTDLEEARDQDAPKLALVQLLARAEQERVAALTPAQRRQEAAAKQRERERDAEAAGTKVSPPASATACAASIFPT